MSFNESTFTVHTNVVMLLFVIETKKTLYYVFK